MKISVALCTFHGEAHLVEQLQTIKQQTRPPDELVVCDDRSDDRTADLIEDFARAAGFAVRFRMNDCRRGAAANYAGAISLGGGDLVAFCDQDDLWEPDKLACLESVFDRNARVLAAFSDLAIVTE